MNKKYPFKFLKAYEKDDKDIFFGRDEEIKDLYRMTFQSNLMLLYGGSGTGKTSLIRCGLSNRFESSQWLDLYVRRGDNINVSLLAKIKEKLPELVTAPVGDAEMDWFENLVETQSPTQSNGIESTPSEESPIVKAIKDLYQATFTPIYLILDQFEELYTIGNKAEQEELIETISELVKLSIPLKIIIVIREEYLSNLYELEKAVPQLRNKKLRLEAMESRRVENVILEATSIPSSNIELKKGEEQQIAETIVDKIREGGINIKLPYLQVFMDRLYEKASGEAMNRDKEVIIGLPLVSDLGEISDVLVDFIERQNRIIYQKISKSHKDLPYDIVWRMLSPFTTIDGTKIPIKENDYRAIKKSLRLDSFPNEDELIKHTLAELENYRILRYRETSKTYEVTHDILAKKIAEKRSEEEKVYLKAKRIVKEGHTSFLDTKSYLGKAELNFIEPYFRQLKEEISPEEHRFIKESRRKRERKKNIVLASILGAFIGLLLVLVYVKYQQEKARAAEVIAVEAQEIAEENFNRADSLQKVSEKNLEAAIAAKNTANAALKALAKTNFDANIENVTKSLKNLNTEAAENALQTAEKSIKAYERYNTEEVVTLNVDTIPILRAAIENVKSNSNKYTQNLKRAGRLAQNDRYIAALDSYKIALESIRGEELEATIIEMLKDACEYYQNEIEQHSSNRTPAGIELANRYASYMKNILDKAELLNLKEAQEVAALRRKYKR